MGGADGEKEVTVRYLTPHNKWSIHSEYQDNLFMLSLSRGGQCIWMAPQDADAIGVKDNDWIEAVNRNGVVVARAIVSHRMPAGTVYMHHAQERTVERPQGGDHRQARRHPQLADPGPDEADAISSAATPSCPGRSTTSARRATSATK